MNREDIEKSQNGRLIDLGGNKNLLVSFGGIRQGLGIPVFEFFNSVLDFPCDKIFLRDFRQAWYQKGVDSEIDSIDKLIEYLKTILSQHKYEKVCFLGNSMGGYAAILFGAMLNVNNVISFAPQTFIDRYNRLKYLDMRWMKQMLSISFFKNKRKEFFDLKLYLEKHNNFKTIFDIYYAEDLRIDKMHSERLKGLDNIILHPVKDGGHTVVKVIRSKGELKKLIQTVIGS